MEGSLDKTLNTQRELDERKARNIRNTYETLVDRVKEAQRAGLTVLISTIPLVSDYPCKLDRDVEVFRKLYF